ncbi:MAG: guanylate kinase [Dehalococcoidia bacterium]
MVKNAGPLIIIISGPSGVGKDAILNAMKKAGKPYFFAVTATTRPKRPGEIDGVDYRFIGKEEFERLIGNGGLLEWANVYGNFYGVPRKPIEDALGEGRDAIVKVDIQGTATIKHNAPEAISIFISPPSMEELRRRLVERKTESGTDLELRLKTAHEEMKALPSFDYVVVSQKDKIEKAILQIEAIIKAIKSR